MRKCFARPPRLGTIVIALCPLAAPCALAQNFILQHQGQIEISGVPFNGNGQIKAVLYSDVDSLPYNGGETAIWSNSSASPATINEPAFGVTISVNHGRFILGLGDTSLSGMAKLPRILNVSGTDTLRIRSWFRPSTTSGSFQLLTPDIALGTQPFAPTAHRFQGIGASATGNSASASGQGATAAAEAALAIGSNSQASSVASVAMGENSSSSSIGATAIGKSATASGLGALAIGFEATATGTGSTALGSGASATRDRATAIGHAATAEGTHSTAIGTGSRAYSYGETALGLVPAPYTPISATSWQATDRLFSIGNGNPFDNLTAGNSLTILKNGSVGIRTTEPEALLHVVSNTTASRSYFTPQYVPQFGDPNLIADLPVIGLRLRAQSSTSSITNGFGTGMSFILQGQDSTTTGGFIGTVRDGSSDAHNSFVFHTANGGSATEKMRLDRFGNLTISGTLIESSDRNRKNVGPPADSGDLLAKVRQLPLHHWNYLGDPATHLGPVAQDFRSSFRLGHDERRIVLSDADGIALAATRALAGQSLDLDSRLKKFTRDHRTNEASLHELDARLTALESQLTAP